MIVAYFLPGTFGWFFLIFVLAAESMLLSKYLTNKMVDNRIVMSVIVSNIVTTIIGYVLFDKQNSGGHLLNWIPVDYYGNHVLMSRTVFMLVSTYIGSVVIESFVNVLILKKYFTIKKIFSGTSLVNLVTYIVAGVIIFLYCVYNY